jgi:hypothetical protein
MHLRTVLGFSRAESRAWIGAVSAWLLLLTAVTTATPLVLGARSLERRDF